MSEFTPVAELNGHAAVGRVTGVRNGDGSAPEWVEIRFKTAGEEYTAMVRRASGRVEWSDDDRVRFAAKLREDSDATETITVDYVTAVFDPE